MTLKMLIVGLTGGIVSGKTTVAKIMKELGAEIIDADEIAYKVVRPQQAAWKSIVQHFGGEILKDNQEIDRKKLASMVFSNPEKLKLLNQLTHPEIIASIKEKIEQLKNISSRDVICVIDAPLLFEAHIEYMMDKIIVVYLSREEQIKRLLHRDGLTRREAIKRIESQMPMGEKVYLSDYVINNCIPLKGLKEQVIDVWIKLEKVLHHLSTN
jgi:dephospho-CoA kinase